MNRNLSRAIKISKQVRYWADKNFKYMLVEEMPPIHRDLCGACAILSYILYRRLKNNKVKHVELCYHPGHVFIRVGTHLIDITATQFKPYKNIKVNVLDFYKRLNSDIEAYNTWYRYRINASDKKAMKQRFSTWENTSPFYKKLRGFINMGIKGIDY